MLFLPWEAGEGVEAWQKFKSVQTGRPFDPYIWIQYAANQSVALF